jgi:type IV secretory pathway VirB10-like protein
MMVEASAAARWRQDRIWGMQKVAFDHDVTSSPTTSTLPPLRAVLSLHNSADSVRTHELLLRYDIAFDRQISRALLRLQQLQDRRAKRTEEQCPPNSVLREAEKTVSEAEPPADPNDKPVEKTIAPTPPIPDSNDARTERTRQSTATKQPITHLPASAPRSRDRKISPPRDVPSLRVR